jgi:hypothetical protein
VAREPRYYEPLREAQRDALKTVPDPSAPTEVAAPGTAQPEQQPPHEEQEEPSRPTQPYGQTSTWTGEGGMAQQQASALAAVRANHEQRALDRDITPRPPTPEPTTTPEANVPEDKSGPPNPPETKDERPQIEEQTSASPDKGSVELTDARAARAEQLARLVEAEEQSHGPELDPDHSQET